MAAAENESKTLTQEKILDTSHVISPSWMTRTTRGSVWFHADYLARVTEYYLPCWKPNASSKEIKQYLLKQPGWSATAADYD